MHGSKRFARDICMMVFMSATMFLLIGSASAYTGEKYAKQAKITLEAAQKIALKAVPGKITDKELEVEKGGSGLRYSFDISYQGKTHEVGVDAKTGKVLENTLPGPNAD